MIIGIDIDDTISDTYGCIFPYAQKFTTEELRKDIQEVDRNFATHMYFSDFHNWEENEKKQFLDKYYETVMTKVKPKLFAVETINKLKEEGHTIFLITARFPSNKFDIKELTLKWLKENNINYDELIINIEDKVQVAKDKHIDIFVDDSTKNCDKMEEAKIKTYMMDTIINLNHKNDKVKRVYSWPHLYQEITKFKEENK